MGWRTTGGSHSGRSATVQEREGNVPNYDPVTLTRANGHHTCEPPLVLLVIEFIIIITGARAQTTISHTRFVIG
jgi:hypothetical protein